jgi:hypothetical protein
MSAEDRRRAYSARKGFDPRNAANIGLMKPEGEQTNPPQPYPERAWTPKRSPAFVRRLRRCKLVAVKMLGGKVAGDE